MFYCWLWQIDKHLHPLNTKFKKKKKLPQIWGKKIYPLYKKKISVESVYVVFRENGYFPNSISDK